MKSFFLIHLLAGLAYMAGGIWAVVSFILYLVKDRPFDWTSVWLFGAGLVVAVINFAMKASSMGSGRGFGRNFPR